MDASGMTFSDPAGKVSLMFGFDWIMRVNKVMYSPDYTLSVRTRERGEWTFFDTKCNIICTREYIYQ